MSDRPTQLETEKKPDKEDPGMFETIGSFPVWMLRIIDLLTPDFLIKKSPPGDQKPRK